MNGFLFLLVTAIEHFRRHKHQHAGCVVAENTGEMPGVVVNLKPADEDYYQQHHGEIPGNQNKMFQPTEYVLTVCALLGGSPLGTCCCC